jgi:hypothetical protein
MLPALAVAFVISEGAITLGNRCIVFLDAPTHFRDQPPAQRGGILQHRIRECVFCLELHPNIGRQGFRPLQDVLPVGSFHPGVIVPQDPPVHDSLERFFCGQGGGRQR